MSLCSVGPRVGGTAVRIGACQKAEAVSPKANPPSSNLRNGRRKRQPAEQKRQLAERQSPKRRVPKSGSSESEGQPAQRQSPKRCMPKSGSSEPEGQPAEGNLRSGRRKNQLAQRPLRSGACRKAEVVSPKANSPSGNLRNGRRKNELAQQPLRSGACRKAEAVNPKDNPPSGRTNPPRAISEAEGNAERRKPPEPRAVKPAGRSRETRGRRSSADTPTNTIEKRDCDTLGPSEAS